MPPKSTARTVLQPLGIALVLAALVRGALHIYSIPSASMTPTLAVGDRIVVTRYFGSAPERGHVIVFRAADGRELLVKRVIGVGGDVVDSRLGRVRVDGHTLPEPYVLREAAAGAIESQSVPSGCYFVLGDNRDDSVDSRSWGVVPQDRVVGRARLVLWRSAVDDDDAVSASTGAHATAARARDTSRVFKWIE